VRPTRDQKITRKKGDPMADNPPGPADPEDHYRLQDEPPGPAAGGTPRPKPPRPAERARRPRPERAARRDRDTAKAATAPPGGGWFSWPKRKPTNATQIITLVAIVVPLIAFAAAMAIWQNQHRAWEQSAFGAAMDDYLAPAVNPAPGAPRPAVGKGVMVDVNQRKLDYLQESLPDEMRAASPAEVTTVVQLRYAEQEVGKYTGGGKALKVTLTVTVVDRATHTVLDTRTFVGADPPQFARADVGEDVRGELPVKDIIDYLKQLHKGQV
jgi:hypothetical protein